MSQPVKKRRSRNGCIECRNRHRKCDEKKPSCTQCLSTNRKCVYEFRLSWGGRSFDKSRFGKCLKADPGLQAVSEDQKKNPSMFVYTFANHGAAESSSSLDVPPHDCAKGPLVSDDHQVSSDPEASDEVYQDVSTSVVPFNHQHQDDTVPMIYDDTDETSVSMLSGLTTPPVFDFSLLNSINSAFHPFSWLSPANRALLDHFISCTTTALSCHQLIRHEITSVLVPMAAEAPYLLSSLLCLAATNRISLGLDQSTVQLDRLKAITIRQLLNVISIPEKILEDAVIACVLVLCTTDIVSHGQSPGSWRTHLHGAATILFEHLKRAKKSGSQYTSLPLPSSVFWRWFVSIETATLITGGKAVLPNTMPRVALASLAFAEHMFAEDEIDDFAGFSTSLIPVFDRIKQLEDAAAGGQCDSTTITASCSSLINEINNRLTLQAPFFRPDVATSLSSDQRSDFAAINESFHHVALLRIYRNICRFPSSDLLVQRSVSTIISLCASTRLLREPCPRVAVLQPLFAAGCEAVHQADKMNIKYLLERQEMAYGLGNAHDARLFLEELWKRREEDLDFEGNLKWDEVMLEKGLDILPY